MIDRKAVFHRLGLIILAGDQLAAADIADALGFGRHCHDVVACAALAANPASAHALHDGRVSDLQGDDMIELDTGCLKSFRLRDRAGHTV